MGCTSSKYSSEGGETTEYSGETKGTTIVGLWYDEGILIGVDSRTSNEIRLDKPLRINNDKVKMFQISSYIIAVMSGTVIDCRKMCQSVRSECIIEFEKNGESVAYALQLMCAHLRGLPENIKNDKAFGVLMAGWDEQDGLQLYRIFIIKGRVTSEQIYKGCTTLGSGSKHAQRILQSRYEFGMNGDQVAEVALEALYNSTFFDKFTGGTLRRYKIKTGKPFIAMRGVDPFDVPYPRVRSRFDSQYYSLQEYESRILFLIYSTRFTEPLRTYQLINHFRKYGGKEAVAAHLVVKKMDFYFHRVVFKSKEDALKVWNYVGKNSEASHHTRDTFELLQYFPHRLDLESDVPVYVNESSEKLLQLIHNSN